MDDRPANSEDRLETSLRHWGARRSVAHAQETLPALASPRRSMWRLPMMAAAAVALLALGGLIATFVQRSQPSIEVVTVGVPPAATGQVTAMRLEITRLKIELDSQQAAISALREIIAKAPSSDQLKDAEDRLAKAQEKLAISQSQAAERLEAMKKDYLATIEDLRQGQERAVKRATALDEELAAIKTRQAKDVTALNEELAAVKARELQQASDMRAMYLASVAPGLDGWAARQAAAREHRMLERLPAVRRDVDDPAARQLLDRLEVALTRLDLMDADNKRDADSLVSALTDAKTTQAIDATVSSRVGGPAFRAWLLEAKMILAGVEHVG